MNTPQTQEQVRQPGPARAAGSGGIKVACWLAIGLGFAILAVALWGRVAAGGAALGVFFLLLGLYGFLSLRVAEIDRRLRALEGKPPGID